MQWGICWNNYFQYYVESGTTFWGCSHLIYNQYKSLGHYSDLFPPSYFLKVSVEFFQHNHRGIVFMMSHTGRNTDTIFIVSSSALRLSLAYTSSCAIALHSDNGYSQCRCPCWLSQCLLRQPSWLTHRVYSFPSAVTTKMVSTTAV